MGHDRIVSPWSLWQGDSVTIYTDIVQRSPEWYAIRAGKLTGSIAKAVVSAPSTATYRNAKAKLVVERLNGKPYERAFSTPALEQGKELEPIARAAYEARTGYVVSEVGFVSSDQGDAGCSPDGVVFDAVFDKVNGDVLIPTGEVQIKCPQAANHLHHLTAGIPDDYLPQILHHLWITGAQWIDFVSYNPDFPPAHQLYVCRYYRNEDRIEEYARKARNFLSDVNATTQQLLRGNE